MSELPVAWRTSWSIWTGRTSAKFIKIQNSQTFRTRDFAEAHKQTLKADYGDDVAVCVTPVFISPTTRSRKFDERQIDTKGGWPIAREKATRGAP